MLCYKESELQGLFFVQSRITEGSVIEAQVILLETLAATNALSDGIACEFKMNASEIGPVLLVNLERGRQLREDGSE